MDSTHESLNLYTESYNPAAISTASEFWEVFTSKWKKKKKKKSNSFPSVVCCQMSEISTQKNEFDLCLPIFELAEVTNSNFSQTLHTVSRGDSS